MTEKEKMINEKLYNPEDKELKEARIRAKKICDKYNSIDSRDIKRFLFSSAHLRNSSYSRMKSYNLCSSFLSSRLIR